jgi:hypothetical protein
MGSQSEAAVSGLEIEKVRPIVRSAFDYDALFYGDLKKKTPEIISKRDMRIPIRLKPGGKFRHVNPDGGDYGRGSGITYDKAVIGVQHLMEAVEWTDESEWATDSERKAVLDSFKDGLAKALEEMQRNLDSVCMTDGTGVIGTATVYAVAGGVAVPGADRLTFTTDGFRARLFRFDMDVNVYNAALTVNRTLGAERTIVFHDPANNIIEITPSLATGIATDKIVLSGLTATPPVSIFGVPYHHSNASTGTWLGFNRATTPEIRANRVNAAGPFALPLFRLALNKPGDRTGKKKIKYTAWTHPAQTDAYEQITVLSTIVNQMPNGKGADMFYDPDNMQMAGVPVKTSFSWDRTRIDLISRDAWGRVEMKPADFLKKNGKYIFEGRGVSGGVAGYNIVYPRVSTNIYIDNPAEGSYIDALTVPTGY